LKTYIRRNCKLHHNGNWMTKIKLLLIAIKTFSHTF